MSGGLELRGIAVDVAGPCQVCPPWKQSFVLGSCRRIRTGGSGRRAPKQDTEHTLVAWNTVWPCSETVFQSLGISNSEPFGTSPSCL